MNERDNLGKLQKSCHTLNFEALIKNVKYKISFDDFLGKTRTQSNKEFSVEKFTLCWNLINHRALKRSRDLCDWSNSSVIIILRFKFFIGPGEPIFAMI